MTAENLLSPGQHPWLEGPRETRSCSDPVFLEALL
jgi:hypothetical protein